MSMAQNVVQSLVALIAVLTKVFVAWLVLQPHCLDQFEYVGSTIDVDVGIKIPLEY